MQICLGTLLPLHASLRRRQSARAWMLICGIHPQSTLSLPDGRLAHDGHEPGCTSACSALGMVRLAYAPLRAAGACVTAAQRPGLPCRSPDDDAEEDQKPALDEVRRVHCRGVSRGGLHGTRAQPQHPREGRGDDPVSPRSSPCAGVRCPCAHAGKACNTHAIPASHEPTCAGSGAAAAAARTGAGARRCCAILDAASNCCCCPGPTTRGWCSLPGVNTHDSSGRGR